tara:strand:+ start:5823 stop:6317 length:495 start_codon:yes stop_codon:yes gene_type:complete
MKDEKKKITDDMINQVIYKLTIISYIKQGEKLYCDDQSNIFIDNSYIPSLSRYMSNQSRVIALKNIKDVIDDVIYITDFVYRNELSVKKNEKEKNDRQIKSFFKESNEKILKNFYIKMTCVLDGLNNLKLTYLNDNTIKTSIDLLIGRIQTRINKLESILIIAV